MTGEKVHLLLTTSATVLAALVTVRWPGEITLSILWPTANQRPGEGLLIHKHPGILSPCKAF